MKTIRNFLIFMTLLLPAQALADNPAVLSFTASPSTISSSYTTILSWTLQGSTGSSLYFSCPLGIKITKTDGSSFPCNIRNAAGSNLSDSVGFNIINVSGGIVTVHVLIYPKDLNGRDYDAGVKDTYITVSTTPQPITDFTSSTTTVAIGESMTLSWKSHDIDGVNLQFDCDDAVRIFASGGSSTSLPCSTLAFTSNLPASGSSSFTFTNSSFFTVPLKVRVLPMIVTGSYDAIHSLLLSLNISGKQVAPETLIDSFTVSKTKIYSGDPLVFSWSAPRASGVNFQIICSETITVTDSQSTTTVNKIPCNNLAFNQSLSAVSTTTLYFANNSGYAQTLSVSLLPQNSDGTYNGIKSKKIDIIVGTNPPTVQSEIKTPSIAPPSPQSASIKAVRTITFTQYLQQGSRGGQVEALQKFLTQDKVLYPEGLITGYFGVLTESAVKRFQDRYGIARQGDPGFGFVGPKTRAKINSLEYF